MSWRINEIKSNFNKSFVQPFVSKIHGRKFSIDQIASPGDHGSVEVNFYAEMWLLLRKSAYPHP